MLRAKLNHHGIATNAETPTYNHIHEDNVYRNVDVNDTNMTSKINFYTLIENTTRTITDLIC